MVDLAGGLCGVGIGVAGLFCQIISHTAGCRTPIGGLGCDDVTVGGPERVPTRWEGTGMVKDPRALPPPGRDLPRRDGLDPCAAVW